MSDNLLQRIQTLQFEHKEEAEALLIAFLRGVYSPQVEKVELRPLAVSLNSFNGYITLQDGKLLFFKTHTEPDTVIGEYYNASKLADAGYPIIRPIFSSTEVGRQVLIYEIVESISVFDLAWSIECGNDDQFTALTTAQEEADRQLFDLYTRTLQPQSEEEAAKSPIHQLFYHRLTGGRLSRFYGDEATSDDIKIMLPDASYSMKAIRNTHWIINGQVYEESVEDIIQRAISVLHPNMSGVSVIGHGDAHNGNVFFRDDDQPPSLLYFDPAFAGRHSPLLDLAKPLFHNVFAMWMYFPHIKAKELRIDLQEHAGVLSVEHKYSLHPVREMFLQSKLQQVVIPLFKKLNTEHLLPNNWREILKSALFCCPFLTMNLADPNKFPPDIALLGLAMSIEMGSESKSKRSRIDLVLDQIANQLYA
ncbi:MAG: hypothetical protein H0X30_06605 [Anaerolineae bacterium]|nr:hypothetical protein [Anaerolineae bacterium]